MTAEDDTYSTIFTALKHPIRRNILRRLSISSTSYTSLLTELGIENGLLNYHIESLHELIRKNEDGTYALSEFGLAGLSLIKRIEDPVTIQTDKAHRNRTIILQVVSVLLIVALSVSSWSLYQGEQALKSELSEKQSQYQALLSRSQAYASLLDSNITTPVSKFESVAKALSWEGWNSTSLSGMEVTAVLKHVRMFTSNDGRSRGYESLGAVTTPVEDYSPRVEYNVTSPGANPTVVGTMTYRYVWLVTVDSSGNGRSVPPPGMYIVDASTGELFVGGMLGFRPAT